jgi:hypothetical protein
MNKVIQLSLGAMLALSSGASQAALNDRGGGLLYDDVLNVTWLQDANYAKTSGYDSDGLMTWSQAMTWAENLSYVDTVRNVTWSDWRLPIVKPVNGISFNLSFLPAGTSDYGFNITSPASELSYMYYVNLRLKGYYNTSGQYQPDFGVFGSESYGGQKDVGLVKNLQSFGYWSGTEFPGYSGGSFGFGTYDGGQGHFGQDVGLFAWAVRPGDVAAVPEPETYGLMLAGLGVLAVARRKRRG